MAVPVQKRFRIEDVTPATAAVVRMPAGFMQVSQAQIDKEIMMSAAAEFQSTWTESIAITMASDAEAKFQGWARSSDADELRKLEQIVGRFWKVHEVNGLPAYKKEGLVEHGGGTHSLFIWYDGNGGWIFSIEAMETADQFMWAWCKCHEGDYSPRAVHLPFWAKRRCDLVRLNKTRMI